MQKESVIEREIRLAREREEAYRREKGLANAPVSAAPSRPAAQPAVARPSPVVTDPRRGVQRIATNRIQQEIQETSQKEKELRDAGKILTMSEETVDAKLTRGFGEKYILFERPVKARRKKFAKKEQVIPKVDVTTAVVQRETLARMRTEPAAVVDEPLRQQNNQVYRRTHCTAEEKIQSELKEMQMREEELRRLRARQLAQSQPNLAGLGADDLEDTDPQDHAHMYTHEVNGLRSVLSNPNLLEDEPEQTQFVDVAGDRIIWV